MTETSLQAEKLTDGWTVVDDEGGRWWPNAAAMDQIENADDQGEEAVRICTEEPMRGTWTQ